MKFSVNQNLKKKLYFTFNIKKNTCTQYFFWFVNRFFKSKTKFVFINLKKKFDLQIYFA